MNLDFLIHITIRQLLLKAQSPDFKLLFCSRPDLTNRKQRSTQHHARMFFNTFSVITKTTCQIYSIYINCTLLETKYSRTLNLSTRLLKQYYVSTECILYNKCCFNVYYVKRSSDLSRSWRRRCGNCTVVKSGVTCYIEGIIQPLYSLAQVQHLARLQAMRRYGERSFIYLIKCITYSIQSKIILTILLKKLWYTSRPLNLPRVYGDAIFTPLDRRVFLMQN